MGTHEELAFWAALFATALFVFIALSIRADGYEHAPLSNVGAPFAALIGVVAFGSTGGRLVPKFGIWKALLAVVCTAALPLLVAELLGINQTPPNVHTGTIFLFLAYAGISQLAAIVFLVIALMHLVKRRH
jgi:hypothetical protein